MLVGLVAGTTVPQTVYASSASVFVSPSSSSVEKDKNITVQVRVDSGADSMDTAEARITFDNSRLQYVSHSAGDFTTFQQNTSSNSLEYVGFATGGTSGNKRLFSITFKAVNTGTASLSLSGVRVASGGSDLAVSSSGGSINVTSPSSGDSGSSGGSSSGGGSGGSSGGSTGGSSGGSAAPSTGSGTSSPATEAEESPEPPEFTKKPTAESTQGTIIVRIEADKPSEVRLRYRLPGDDWETIRVDDLKTSHEIRVGEDRPLQAGMEYELEVRLTDEDGNNSSTENLTVRTKGVTYRVKITDKDGQPLSDHPVELHSEPLKTTTDSEGYATFDDVTPGEHTLVFEIDGITIRQPVMVGADISLGDSENEENGAVVALPFSLANTQFMTQQIIRWDIAWYAGAAGALLMFVLQHSPVRKFALGVVSKMSKLPKIPIHH